jgi:hypothetical protein
MTKLFYFLFIFSTVFISCKKSTQKNTTCFTDIASVRTITDKVAYISFTDNQYYIKEEFTIDTRLLPCNLEEEFKVNGLRVIVSGEVKNSLPNYPCCTDNFIITKITK